MRRLAHSLSALLVVTTLLTVVAMGGLMALNLNRGFSDYLQARELDRLKRFAKVLESRLENVGMAESVQWPQEFHQALRIYGQSESSSAGRSGFDTKPVGHPPPR
jgi:hypothetical protein